jgi:hypothetical protein
MRLATLALAFVALPSEARSYPYPDLNGSSLTTSLRNVNTAAYDPDGITCQMTFGCDVNRGDHAKHLRTAIENIPDNIVSWAFIDSYSFCMKKIMY